MSNAVLWGADFRLDSDSGDTIDNAIAGLPTGKFVGAFTISPFLVGGLATHGQILDANGDRHGSEFAVDPGTDPSLALDQEHPAVVALSNGNFVVAWEDDSVSAPDARARMFDSEGHALGASFSLDPGGGVLKLAPQLAAGTDGGFAAIWERVNLQSNAIEDVVRTFDSSSTPVAGIAVNSSGGQHPDVAVLANGEIVAAWEDVSALRARIFSTTGAPPGQEFAITANDAPPSQHVQLTALKDGGFAAVWQSIVDNEDFGINLQIFDTSGGKVGDPIVVDASPFVSGSDAHVAQIADGRLAVAWVDESAHNQTDVKLQLYDLDGSKSGDELLVNQVAPGFGHKPDVTALADGRFVVSWDDLNPSDMGTIDGEHAQIFDPREGPVHLTGTPLNDDDYGTAFDDSMKGLGGDDRFDGGPGIDTAIYAGPRSQYQIIDRGDHIEVRGPEGTDSLYNVEKLQFADTMVSVGPTPPETAPPPGPPPAEPPPAAPPEQQPVAYVTGLFDTRYYLTHNGDVSAAKVSGIDHFNGYGWHEGRDPNAFFDTALYLAVNKDVAASGVNPLTEYHQGGWGQGRDPGPSFDNKLYLAHNPDVAAAGVDPLEHYLQHGLSDGRQIYAAVGTAVNGFDAEWYVFHNPDVAAAGVDPLQHYEQYGWKEGRNPNPWFDTRGYLAHYADVAAAGIDPLQHYEQNGWKEGRDPSGTFSTSGYLAANGDVAAAHASPLDHFINHGVDEGRIATSDGWH